MAATWKQISLIISQKTFFVFLSPTFISRGNPPLPYMNEMGLHKGKQTLFLSPAPLSLQGSLSQEIDGWLTSPTHLTHCIARTQGDKNTIPHLLRTLFSRKTFLMFHSTKRRELWCFCCLPFLSFLSLCQKRDKATGFTRLIFFLFLRLTMLTLGPPTSDWMKKGGGGILV